MNPALRAAAAFCLVLAAMLSDWLWQELFMRRESPVHVAAALAANAAVLLLAYVAARALLPQRALATVWRSAALLGFALLVFTTWRMSAGGAGLSGAARWAFAASALALAVGLALRLREATADRLMHAIGLASLAFVLAPVATRWAAPAPPVWIGPATASASPATGTSTAGPTVSPQGTLFLLLDELGYEAAGPLVADLKAAGLNLRYDALRPVGENTINVIPQLFSGKAFPHARPCGISTICSGATTLDFSRIAVQRGDVDVTGLLLPYCDIAGLRSCFALPLPHEFGSAYRSLAGFYLRRMGLSMPAPLEPPHAGSEMQRGLLQAQLDFIHQARFWAEGGVLYAHMPLPHPPGMDSHGSLDADYAGNVQVARRVVADLVAHARKSFGERFTVVITSDHPLRQYWCTAAVYAASGCHMRPEFRSTQVPLIVASPRLPAAQTLASNGAVFDVLNAAAGSVRP